MIRRTFDITVAMSLLAAVLLAVAIVWGVIRPGEYVWARRGTFHQFIISPQLLCLSWMGGWPRNEPITRIAGPGQLHVVYSSIYPGWRCPLGGGYSGEAFIYYMVVLRAAPRDGFPFNVAGHVSNYRLQDVDPWWHDSPETLARMSSVWIDPRRCFLPAAVLPVLWLTVWLWRWRKRQGQGFPVEISKAQA